MQKLALFTLSLFTLIGCQRSPSDVWNDTQSAGRHVNRGLLTLCGKHTESRQVRSREEFEGDDFVAIEPQTMRTSTFAAQAKTTPGDVGSSLPGIDAFRDPSTDPHLAAIFQNIHFDYNSSLLKGNDNAATAEKIAGFLQHNPNAYLYIEGHCDKRGPTAFNYALGANRSNAVRNFLIQQGIDPERIFTVSYGKDKPMVDGEGEEFYRLNRRAQFRIYER